MRFVRRRAILISVLAILVLFVLGLSALFAGGSTPQYDVDNSGVIERDEAYNALRAYFDGDLTQEQTLDVLFHYWADQPVDQPPAAASSQPTPTPAPTSTPLPLSIHAPTITFTRVNTENMQVNWKHNAHNVIGYEIQYRLEGREWMTWRKGTSAGVSGTSSKHSLTLSVGDRVEVQVRSLIKNGASPWTSETLVVPPPPPTHTPTPTPLPTPIPLHITLSNAYGNGCVGREKLPSHTFPRLINETASDIRIAAMFKNPPAPGRRPWEAPKLPQFSYGFMVRSVPDEGIGLLVLVSSDNMWSVALHETDGLRRIMYEARDGTLYEYDRAVKTFHQS